MPNQIMLFENKEVRFILEDESFWVVGADVLKALEYSDSSISQVNNVFSSIPEEWKDHKPIMTLGGTQKMLCLSEQGLYFFLGRSDKPKALPYQKWIAGEVVPSIRKTGEYKLEKPQDFTPTALEAFEIMSRVLATCYEGNQLTLALDKCCKRLTSLSALKETETQLIAPKQEQLYTPTELGSQLEPMLSAKKVNHILAEMGWQVKVGDKWEAIDAGKPFAVYLDTGKQRSDGTPIRQLKWTADALWHLASYIQSDNYA